MYKPRMYKLSINIIIVKRQIFSDLKCLKLDISPSFYLPS